MQMLNVNTIEYNGRKAVLNSYSDHPALVEDIKRQRERWTTMFPRATVQTERLSEIDTMELVASSGSQRFALAYEIGEASKG